MRNSKRIGPDANTRQMYEHFVKSDYDILLTADSDMVFQEETISFLRREMQKTDGVLTLYNSAKHKTKSCGMPSLRLCEKESIGAGGVAITKHVATRMLRKMTARESNFDWGFVSYYRNQGIRMYSSRMSMAYHFGNYGKHRTGCTQGKGNAMHEKARDFDWKSVSDWVKFGLRVYDDNCTQPTVFAEICSCPNGRPRTANSCSYKKSGCTSCLPGYKMSTRGTCANMNEMNHAGYFRVFICFAFVLLIYRVCRKRYIRLSKSSSQGPVLRKYSVRAQV